MAAAMASWNRGPTGNLGYWESQTNSTTVAYGASPPSSPPHSYVSENSYHQTNGMGAHQAYGMGAQHSNGMASHHSSAMGSHNPYGMGSHHSSGMGGHHSSGGMGSHHSSGMGVGGHHSSGGMGSHHSSGMGGHHSSGGMGSHHSNGGMGSHHISGGMGALTIGQDNPFDNLLPSSFPPGTDPKVVAFFNKVDRDGSGFIDEKELKMALSSYSSTFSIKTIRLLIYAFAKRRSRVVGPNEFIAVYYGLQTWKAMFHKFDRNRNGTIDSMELREALRNLGYPVSEMVLDILMNKYDKNRSEHMAVGFDRFIECCLTVKGLTDKFKERDQMQSGTATFAYEDFLMTVLPYIVA